MKQIKILGVLAIALTLGLAACNGGGASSGGKSSGNASSKHEHTFDTSKWEADDNYHWHPATCEHTNQKGDRAAHTFGEPYDVVPAACEKAGSQKVKCSICNKEVTQEIAALEHQWVDVPQAEDTAYVAADFGVEGQHTQKCSVCNATQVVKDAALQRGFTISLAEFQKKDDGKVYLRLSGTCTDYTQENFKWAFALKEYNNGEEGGAYLAGKEEPADEDFNIVVELTKATEADADDTFTVDFNLSDIVVPDGVTKPGRYNLTAGPKDNYKTINVTLNPGNYADSGFRYYFRNDQEVGSRLTVCIEELPPFFHFTNAVASFVAAPTEENPEAKEAWVRIYGEALDQTQSKADLEAALAATHTACRFQSQSNNFTTRNEASEFRMEVTEEGGKLIVSVWVNVQFMIDGSDTVYNTHLNLKAGDPINAWRDYTNCVMEGDFDNVLEIGDNRVLTVFSHPLGANDVQNSYGNLGFRTGAPAAEETPAA